ncbi:DUF1206 domain-containing protein [Microbacterium oleivorans]|uniref:DUF1206 domain-containing protein n=1 Tax=Microbacterium oleivorans TaxID=273677 RepID=UPI0009F4BE2B|nr:DUF1206 domain-containing protein [Microbacterium oleivorans]
MTSSATSAAHSAKNSRAVHTVARGGFAASGVVHIVVGIIAISLAFGQAGGEQADQSGALAQLAAAPGGVFLLWAAALGLAALGVWHLLSAVLDRSADSGKDRAVHIVKNGAKGVVYLVIAFSAATFAAGGSTSSAGSTRSLTADLMSTPGGVFLVVAIGIVVIAIAAYLVFKGITRRFERDLSMPAGSTGRIVRILGTVGYIARGVAFAGVGVLFVVGAATNDPEKSTGLDGALRSFADLPAGKVLLVVIGLGWIAYGVYAFFRGRYTRL